MPIPVLDQIIGRRATTDTRTRTVNTLNLRKYAIANDSPIASTRGI